MLRLDGRTALVTGGTQGVGAAIALQLSHAGCDLIIHGLEPNAACDAVASSCRAAGAKVDCIFEDLSKPVPQWRDSFLKQLASFCPLPEISLLVNNAGTCRDTDFLQMDFESYQLTQNLNVAAGYFLTQSFATAWLTNSDAPHGHNRVLFTGSINGLLAEPDHSAYDISKGAVHSMVRSLAVALAPHGIRVNGLAPGLVVTPLTAPALQPADPLLEWMKLHTPNGEVPGAEVCGPAALFLLSDEAVHIHGQIMYVDGGMSAWQQPNPPTV